MADQQKSDAEVAMHTLAGEHLCAVCQREWVDGNHPALIQVLAHGIGHIFWSGHVCSRCLMEARFELCSERGRVRIG